MTTYNVLIADSSAVIRKKIAALLENDDKFNVIGRARGDEDLIEKVIKLSPDIVIANSKIIEIISCDLMHNFHQFKFIPTIVYGDSNSDEKESFINGATNYFNMNYLFNQTIEEIQEFKNMLISAVQSSFICNIYESNEGRTDEDTLILENHIAIQSMEEDRRLLIIGSSTGGPSALQKILSNLSGDFPVPIVIIQHIPVGFTKSLADRFDSICKLAVKEAEHKEILKKGHVYIAPAGQHLTLQELNNTIHFNLNEEFSGNYLYKPSIDIMISSASEIINKDLLIVILTGMGNDGLAGCKEASLCGATIFAESEETCVVYGMPKVIVAENLADKIIPIYNMGEEINKIYVQ